MLNLYLVIVRIEDIKNYLHTYYFSLLSAHQRPKMSETSANINEELIELYRGLPQLWDTRSENYHNKWKRFIAIEKIAKELNLTGK